MAQILTFTIRICFKQLYLGILSFSAMVRSFQVRSVNTSVYVPIATRTQISFKHLRNVYYICGMK